jgi:hypothetical protein
MRETFGGQSVMRSLSITVAMLTLVFVVAGCVKSLPPEKADAVLAGLAAELVKMEGASGDDKMAKVKAVCEKEGVEVASFARYLEENSGADSKLAELIQQAFADELAAKKKAYAAEIAKVEADAKQAASDRKTEILARKQTMENATQAKIAEMENRFKKKQEELKNAIAEIRKQQ